LKVKITSYNELKASYETNLLVMKNSIKDFKVFVKKAIEIFGGEKCAKVRAKIVEKFDDKEACLDDECAGFRAKVLSFKSLEFVVGKPPKSYEENSEFFGVDLKAKGTLNVRRNL